MKKVKRERCCGNCISYVEQRNDKGFCTFAWPPYIRPNTQAVNAHDDCDLFSELPADEKPMNELDIVWVMRKK